MNTPHSRTKQPSRPDEALALQLREKAEQAVAASIHHASLSQQYLALSQKYSAVAEQCLTGSASPLQQIARALDDECDTGRPAPPLGFAASPTPVAPLSEMPQQRSSDSSPVNAPIGHVPDPAQRPTQSQTATETKNNLAVPAAPAAIKTDGDISPRPSKTRRRRRVRRPTRELVRNLHLKTQAPPQKVRIKAKKKDLKPRTRNPVEELKDSRRPAAISCLVCAVIAGLLAMVRLTYVIESPLQPIVAGFTAEQELVDDSVVIEPILEEEGEQTVEEQPEEEEEEPPEEPEPEPEPPSDQPAEQPEQAPATDDVANTEMAAATQPAESVEKNDSGGLDGRTADGRQAMLEKYGGSAASESAVGQALDWLVSVQRRDGSWDFRDIGGCSSPGTAHNPIGGTAYALLPFLAAGQTHQQGAYRANVRAGLDFLLKAGIVVPAGYDLRGVLNKGNKDAEPNEAYYVHGAATLVLCEAWWMTRDRRLKDAAQGAVAFLVNSQDPRGGGWRYLPQQPGSTSVTAIQVMALKAAEKSGIAVPDATWQGVSHYLDSIQVDGKGRYGYEITKRSYQASLTAMALLSRMYLGWGRDDGDLRDGIGLLSRKGPYDNLYYNYFATQVMRNWGGEEWQRWNLRLRDDLVRWQVQDGPEAGSWTPRDRADYSVAGGRLLTTCLATLTLEVYYRYDSLLPDPASDTNAPSLTTMSSVGR